MKPYQNHFWPQYYDIRKKEEETKKHKCGETKQYAIKQQIDHGKKSNMPKDKWKWKHNHSKPMALSKSRLKTEVYRNTVLPQEIKKNLK